MFGGFKFKDYINQGLDSIGFKEPTEIQKIVIEKAQAEQVAYEMPSMFATDDSVMEEDFGVL